MLLIIRLVDNIIRARKHRESYLNSGIATNKIFSSSFSSLHLPLVVGWRYKRHEKGSRFKSGAIPVAVR